MPRVLFVTQHRPDRSPGQRFRFEQYIPALERSGWHCDHSAIVSAEDDSILYKKGNYLKKARFLRRSLSIRDADVKRMGDYDIIFIYREALMTRSTRYEQLFRRSRAKLIFDFDDSIWLPNTSEANRRWGWMKGTGKTSKLIGLCDRVFAGNEYLAAYARRFNAEGTRIVPTTIDTDAYQPRGARQEGPVVIGWSGSITTIQHFRHAIPALQAVKARFGERITLRVVGDSSYAEPSLGVQGLPWRKDTELDDLRSMDIGIMPLPDDDWSRGKCGLKGLQYMALEIPTIMSPVGVNTEIINDGVDGFLASSTEEWVEKISRLVEDAELRQRIGRASRQTVVDRYSLRAWQGRYIGFYNELIENKDHGHTDQRTEKDRAGARA